MPIYDKPVRFLMKEMADSFALQRGQSFSRQEALDWFFEHYPKIKSGTVHCHLIRLSTNSPSRLHYSAKPSEDDVFFQLDSSTFRLYDPEHDPAPIHESSDRGDGSEPEPDENPEILGSREFAYEKDLQNYLAKNLSTIEPGLSLFEEEGVRGVEFPVGGRFIDLLGVDADGSLVVIELKVSRGYDRVTGQLLRYMAWIRKHQAEPGQGVRGIIVARTITEDLVLACSLLPNVKLFEYELSLRLRPIPVDAPA